MKQVWKWVLILTFCGYVYVCLELLYRGMSDVTMMFCASICAIPMLGLNELYDYEMNFIVQVLLCALFSTFIELGFGVIFNSDYHIWDYRNLPYNYKGLICPQFFLLWCLIATIIIPLLDYIDCYIFDSGQRPYYKITRNIVIYMPIKKRGDEDGRGNGSCRDGNK